MDAMVVCSPRFAFSPDGSMIADFCCFAPTLFNADSANLSNGSEAGLTQERNEQLAQLSVRNEVLA